LLDRPTFHPGDSLFLRPLHLFAANKVGCGRSLQPHGKLHRELRGFV
jgi:hypothetical protein